MILTKNQADIAVKKLKEKLVLRFGNKVQLFLFGSVARGDFYAESDIDILVLFDGDITQAVEKQIVGAAFNVELDDDVVFGLMIESMNDWRTPLFQAMPIHKVIDQEGVRV